MSTRGSPRSAPPSARTYWQTSRTMPWCSTVRMILPVFRISCARRRVRRPRSAALPASTPSPFRARAWSRSCNSPRGATCGRRSFAPGSRAATAAAPPTTRRSLPKWWRCAPSARGCSAIRASPTTGSTIPWRKRRRPCVPCSSASGRRAAAARWQIARPCRRWCRRREKISRSRRGTGAITRRSCAKRAATSTRRRSSRICSSSASSRPHSTPRTACSGSPSSVATASRRGMTTCECGKCATLRDQERLRGDIHPLVVNVMNFSKAGEGEPTLLSFDDAKTLFHEFGHALHALLSDVTYPMIAGTNVLLDWSELPSQLFEHWLERPEILRRFALHYRTGEPLPEDQLRRLLAARTFNQGQTTVEYVASALIDLDMHLKPAAGDGFDIDRFEQAELARIGMPAEIVMRHRPTHFQHVFAGAGYASAYYSYLWSEVLDADAFAAFEETGDIFDAGVAKRLHDDVYAAGGARDPAEFYTAFRGRLPTPDGLLRRRGLGEDAA